MKMDLENKLFALTFFFGVLWFIAIIFQKFLDINPTFIDGLRSITALIVGVFVGAYQKGKGG